MVVGEKSLFWIPEELAYKGQPGRPQGMLVFEIDLLAQPSVPASCDAVVIAAPATPLGASAVKALQTYLQDQGKAFVVGDPKAAADPSPVTSPWIGRPIQQCHPASVV